MMIDSTGSLTIFSLEIIDRGTYICEVNNEIGQAKQQFQIDVYGRILFKIQIKKITNLIFLEPPSSINNPIEIQLDVNAHNSILLPCPIDGHPPPTIVWFRQNNPINRENIIA